MLNLVIQITNNEWRRLNEHLLERAGESLDERERAAVNAFFDLAEPHVEGAQIDMLRGTSATDEALELNWQDFIILPEFKNLATGETDLVGFEK